MKHLMLILIILWSSLSLAQSGGIPTKYMNDAAVDLTRNGQLLFPDEVHELYTASNGKFDISTLNPSETSDLWKNKYLKTLPAEIPAINEGDELTYHSGILSPSGIYRANVVNANGDKKFYTLMLSKTIHSSLLAKSVLRKIGYTVPDIKRLPQVTIKFADEAKKNEFLLAVEVGQKAGAIKNWLVQDLGNSIILQDVVVMQSNHIIYNLAYGVNADIVQGRRILSALSVPLSIVNLTESVNLLSWSAGRVNNNRIALNLDNQEDFQTTWDDGRWIARRLEKLSREDWKEIVASSEVPKPVQQVMLEKIISRRNSIMKLFKIDAEQIKVESDIQNGTEIVDGKVTQQNWPGYASRFAYGDPDSPLSDSDMKSWIKSRAISTAMELALSQINQLPFLGTDIKAINTAKFEAHMADAVAESIQNETPVEVPLKAWVFPTFRGNLILSRNLVTGTYLGTDNLVQLVDTVGVTLSAGVFAGTMGVSTKSLKGDGLMPINVQGGAQAAYMRTYAHLRPVTNIKTSLKYPFKNVIVPLVKADFGKKLALAASGTAKDISAALQPLKEAMNVGESILVTDTLVTGASAQAGANLYGKLLSASIGLNANHTVLSRFHVHRRSQDMFHVYKDIGNKGTLGVGVNIDTLIPLISVNFKSSAGHAKVKFYQLNLDPKHPNVVKAASSLQSALLHSSTRDFDENGFRPFVLKHSFKEKTPSVNLLYWQFIKQNAATDMILANPDGEQRYFRRHSYGNTSGKNYQAYVNAVINHWVGLIFDRGAGLSDATGTNPGYSFKGSAKTKLLTLDQELDINGEVLEPFVSINRVWNGWSIKRKKAEELLEEIRHQYKFQFYNAPILNDTKQILLYNIGVTTLLYKDGLEHLLSLDEKRIKRIFLEHEIQDSLVLNPNIEPEKANEDWDAEKYSDTGVNKFLRLLKRYRKLDLKNKDFRANKHLLKALSYMESKVYLAGIVKLVGGEENIFVTAKITGFREGDESADSKFDSDIRSNSLGQFGSPRILGPVVQMQKNTDMLEGEFFINWMMQRLI
jgi:hypothetical protein